MTDSSRILCLDVDYRRDRAVAAAVAFNDWGDGVAAEEQTALISPIADYVPGQFFRRELPCLLAVLQRFRTPPRLLIVDSYVWLGPGTPGLGVHLHEALDRQVPVIGVAKTRFHSAPAVEILRGESLSPLFVTTIGIEAQVAAENIQRMHGPYRIPTLLKRVDQLCRTADAARDHSSTIADPPSPESQGS